MDETQHRVCWAAAGTPLSHHNASFQVIAESAATTRGIWIADLLPHDVAPRIAVMIETGLQAMRTKFG